MKKLLSQILPFIVLGIALIAFAFGIMLLVYLFIFGALAGLVLFIISWIRHNFFHTQRPRNTSIHKPGKIIDTDEWKKL